MGKSKVFSIPLMIVNFKFNEQRIKMTPKDSTLDFFFVVSFKKLFFKNF